MSEKRLFFIIFCFVFLFLLISIIGFAQGPPPGGGGYGGGGWSEEGCWAFYNNTTCLDPNDEYNCIWHDTSSFGSWGWCDKAFQLNCWQYGNNTTCTNASCSWEGYGYCYRESCWEYKDKASCEQANTTTSGAINCRWETMGTSSTTDDYCYEIGCWIYNTNETCLDASCSWNASAGGWCYQFGCWDYTTETSCNAQQNCEWEGGSNCRYKSCWDYTTNTSCLNTTAHPYMNCRWDDNSKYCYQFGCWDYYDSTNCTNTTDDLDCTWSETYCYEASCHDYTGTNQSACEGSGLNCYWDSYWSECHEKGCWDYYNQSACDGTSGCSWRSSGWCNPFDCWIFNDSSSCENNAYNLTCTWNDDPHCHMISSTPSGTDCWQFNDSTSCTNAGCEWELGWCSIPGCWNYNNNETNCTNSTLHPNWDCVWRSDQYGSWCEEQNCWILNETNCENNTYNLDCVWDNSSKNCYMKGCWDYTTNTSCLNTTLHPKFNCSWNSNDSYCYEEGCWNYMNNTTCLSNNCIWQEGGGWCEEETTASVDCWNFENNASCSANDECFWEVWGYCNDKQSCWKQTTKTDCEALTATKRCAWNTENQYCYEKGCWDYSNNTTCLGAGCAWDGSYCYEEGCWKYTSQDPCLNTSDTLDCSWEAYGYCYEEGCWDYSNNETNCTDTGDTVHPDFDCNWQTSGWCEAFNTSGTDCWQYWNSSSCNGAVGCNWSENSWCEEKGPWYYYNQSSCENANFTWRTEGGWCNEPLEMQCWNFNQTDCEGTYNATCRWDGSSCMSKGCWEYYDNASCNNAPPELGCQWYTGEESAGWCEQLDCWYFMNQTECGQHKSDMKCSWATFGWCEQKNCWMIENSSSCLNDTDNLDCSWEESGSCSRPFNPCVLCAGYEGGSQPDCTADADINICNVTHAPWCFWNDTSGNCQRNDTACNSTVIDNCGLYTNNCSNKNSSSCAWPCEWTGGGWCENEFGMWHVDCWQHGDNQTACNETDGCKWKTGHCNEKGCWNYQDSDTCENETLHSNFNCTWHTDGNWCEEKGCWNYYDNETKCEEHNATNDPTMNCSWHTDPWNPEWGWCEEPGCWNYQDNETCIQHSMKGVNCSWHEEEFGGWCGMGGCWDYSNESTCTADPDCDWREESHCERARCWMWDEWNSGNETLCTQKGAEYDLNCTWSNGMCMPYLEGCDAYNGDKAGCWDTMFCWWDESDDTCNSPGDVGGGGWIEDLEGEKQNPGCWIFDYARDYCNESYVDVCRWNNQTSKCVGKSAEAEITCGNIKNSDFCESIPILSTCCVWKNNKCQASPESIACYANIEAPPEGATFCEDYAAYTDNATCTKIAGAPWFMPCKWDGSHCVFRSEDKFSGEKKGCKSITNKKDCEYAGCEWVTEFYCNGTKAVPFGFCKEKTGIGSKSCDAACWACEFRPNGSAWSSSAEASAACGNSSLGYCQYTEIVSGQDNEGRWGYCKVPENIEYIGDCNSDCKACENKPDPQTACEGSNANCKWVADTAGATTIGGWCYPKSEKSCSEDCFRCYEQSDCINYGGGSKGSCVWVSATSICKPKNFDKEICFDSVDNDGDTRVDCDDSDCFSDPFCGGGMISQCWQYTTESDCYSQGNASNCTWIKDPWEGEEWCGLQGENCFLWDGNPTGCGNQTMCEWFPDPKGGFCDIDNSKVQSCFKATTQGACVVNPDCYWEVDPTTSTGGTCKPKIFMCWDKTSQVNCTSGGWSSRCKWVTDTYTGTSECRPICFSKDLGTQTSCDYNENCQWMSGFCDPAQQFGMKMEDCWKYDNDQNACNAAAGCEYSTKFGGGFCDINFTLNDNVCMYKKNQTVCEAAGGGNICKWHEHEGMTFCDLKVFGCGFYQDPTNCTNDPDSYGNCTWVTGGWCECMQPPCTVDCFGINDEPSCNGNSSAGCGWAGPHCEPSCFNITDNTSCDSQTFCAWRQGFCEPKMAKQMFSGMEEKPVDVAWDECGPGTGDADLADELDTCVFGAKEMPDNYGFGINVVSLENAAVCKGKKIVKHTETGPQELTDSGKGTNTTKLYLYLDTDGSETGNCWLWNDPDQEGYEFFFKYIVEIVDGEVKEKKTAYRCKDNNWVVADIKLTAWRTLMCSEIGGSMLAINKDDLKKFETLFTPGQIMRVYAATAGKKWTESNPKDTIGPGYYTPGTIDFMFEDCMTPGVDMDGDGFKSENDPDCFMFYQFGGFIKYEDCFETGIDEDIDGLADCLDPDCKFAPNCVGKGVNVEGYNDRTAPSLTWYEVDKFPDAAFIKYDTNEPANGSVLFYYTSSNCSILNATILDGVLLNPDTWNYTNWHDAPLDNFNFNPQKLNYSLSTNTTYYYKIRVCDPNGNCGLSSCLNFTTPVSFNRTHCPDCEFSFKLEGAADFKIDFGGTGTYTSLSDEVGGCGGSGMKVNYTQASKANVRAEGEGGSAIIFENASLIGVSGTLNVTDGTTTSDGYSVGYTGVPSDVFDNVGGQMRPDVCKIEIPKGTNGNCDILWKCDDNVANCVDITSSATLLDNTATLCIWEIPCDFSTYRTNSPTAGAETAGGGGGGGGGGAVGYYVFRSKGNVNISIPSLAAGKTINIIIREVEDIAFRELNMSVTNNLTKAKIFINKLPSSPVTDVPGHAYHYIEITKENVTDADVDKFSIKFAVSKNWITDNNIDSLTVSLYKWSDGKWNALSTTKVEEDEDEVFYKTETTSLSYFAIAGYKVGEAPTGAVIACEENWQCTEWSDCVNNVQTRTCTDKTACGTTLNKPAETQACIVMGEMVLGLPYTYIIVLIVIIIIVIGALVWKYKYKK